MEGQKRVPSDKPVIAIYDEIFEPMRRRKLLHPNVPHLSLLHTNHEKTLTSRRISLAAAAHGHGTVQKT